jgi:hypothetical protein
VSLILEALKKLDREKQAPDRGVVIMGPTAWPSPREGFSRLAWPALFLAAVVLGGALGALWLLRGPRGQSAADGARAAVPAQPAPAAPAPASRPLLDPPPAAAARPKPRPAPTAPPPDAAAEEPPAEEVEANPPEAAQADAVAPEPPPEEAPAPTPGRKPAATDFQLQAISAQNGHPVALLNDRLVKEGDMFDNVRVVRIGTDEVEIEVAGRRRIVKF